MLMIIALVEFWTVVIVAAVAKMLDTPISFRDLALLFCVLSVTVLRISVRALLFSRGG